jgi:D-arginine dehydrogenase
MRRTVIAFLPNIPVGNHWSVLSTAKRIGITSRSMVGTVLGLLAEETPIDPQDARPEELDIALTVDRLEQTTMFEIKHIQRS